MSSDEAKGILLRAFVAHPDLPTEIQVALAKLIAPKRKSRLIL